MSGREKEKEKDKERGKEREVEEEGERERKRKRRKREHRVFLCLRKAESHVSETLFFEYGRRGRTWPHVKDIVVCDA